MSRCAGMALYETENKRDHEFSVELLASLIYTNAKILSMIGDSDAQLTNSEYYYGIDNDQIEGLKWLKKSAENGNPKGQFELCKNYICGYGGVPKAQIIDLSWCIKSANQGYVIAQAFLGEKYKISGNHEEASRWLNAAKSGISQGAKFGMKDGAMELGILEAQMWEKCN